MNLRLRIGTGVVGAAAVLGVDAASAWADTAPRDYFSEAVVAGPLTSIDDSVYLFL